MYHGSKYFFSYVLSLKLSNFTTYTMQTQVKMYQPFDVKR